MAYINGFETMFSARIGSGLSVDEIREMNYPVGTIFATASDTSPASIMGGTWAKIAEKPIVDVVCRNESIAFINVDANASTSCSKAISEFAYEGYDYIGIASAQMSGSSYLIVKPEFGGGTVTFFIGSKDNTSVGGWVSANVLYAKRDPNTYWKRTA